MRSLKESILDVDANIDELEIPEKPKVSKSDYPYYEQAWYDILNNMLDSKCSSRDYAIYIKIYKEWLSEWSCYIDYDFYHDECNGYIDWKNDIDNYINKSGDISEFLDYLIDEFSQGADRSRLSRGSNSILYALYDDENIFAEQALQDREFIGPKYNKYFNDIKKILKINGVKL